MKKKMIVLASATLLFFACKKDNANPSPANETLKPNMLLATVDGKAKSFMIKSAEKTFVYGGRLSVTAYSDTTISADQFYFEVSGTDSIHTGVYDLSSADLANPQNKDSSWITLAYTTNNYNYLNGFDSAHASIAITSVDATSVQGTFEGKLRYPNSSNFTTITNGRFNAVLTH